MRASAIVHEVARARSSRSRAQQLFVSPCLRLLGASFASHAIRVRQRRMPSKGKHKVSFAPLPDEEARSEQLSAEILPIKLWKRCIWLHEPALATHRLHSRAALGSLCP